MEQLLTYLKQRGGEDWLIGYDNNQFNRLTEELYGQLTQLSKGRKPPKILLGEQNPIRFLASFLAAVAANCPIFLCNPHWVQKEWQQVFDLVQPDLIWGLGTGDWGLGTGNWEDINLSSSKLKTQNPKLIMIPTGGSSGKIRFAIHTWETLTASVRGFHRYFGEKTVNSFCVLPIYHVSGLMQFLRSFLTRGRLVILPYKALKTGERGKIDPREFFISLVPTQLQFLLQSDPGWLSRFHTVLLGGAPAWQSLLNTARKHNIRLAPTYGMTETASQIVTLKPEYFLKENNSSGQVLPHAQVTIRSATGELLGINQIGIISIQADSLCLGYYPQTFTNQQYFKPDDLGFFDAKGYLNIIGRRSYKIITGGENVFPAEVEAAILATQLVTDICVLGLPDQKWGQVVTAVYVPKQPDISTEVIKTAIENKLSKFKQPKYWIKIKSLPRNQQGKVNYERIKIIAQVNVKGNREQGTGEEKDRKFIKGF
ncbi:MAG: 2-succinylbenzoate--CoA ligase [Xenococcaceae cyanobacterium]